MKSGTARSECALLATLLFLISQPLGGQPHPSELREARRSVARGQWSRADEILRRYRQAHPLSGEAAELHARALLNLGHPFDAILLIEDFLKKGPECVSCLRFYSALLMDVLNKPEQAEQALVKAAEIAPRDWQVYEALGRLQLSRNRPAEAVRSLERAVSLAPARPRLAAMLGHAHEAAGRPGDADAAFARALKGNAAGAKPDAAVWRIYAEHLLERDQPERSAEYFGKALRSEPHSADGWLGRARAYERLNRLSEAEADALAAVREEPGRKDAHQLLLRIYRQQGDQKRTQQEMDTIRKLAAAEQDELAAARRMRASLNEAEALLRQGRYKEAIPAYERVIAEVPTFYEAYYAIGVCYSQTGEQAKAEWALRKYLEFQPLSADGHETLGLLLVGASRLNEAKPMLERAIELDLKLPEARKALARILAGERDFERAAEVLQPVLAEAHGEAEAEELHAEVLLGCAKKESCRSELLAAWRARPQAAAYLKAVTRLLVEQSAFDEVTAEMVDRVRKALPGDAGARYLYARWKFESGDYAAAADEALAVARMPSADALMRVRALSFSAAAAERLGQYDVAETRYTEALEHNRRLASPAAPLALNYVNYLITAGKFAEAEPVVFELLRWSPKYGPARLAHARLLAEKGKLDEAAAEGRLALELSGGEIAHARAVHLFLAKTYRALGRVDEANVHENALRTR